MHRDGNIVLDSNVVVEGVMCVQIINNKSELLWNELCIHAREDLKNRKILYCLVYEECETKPTMQSSVFNNRVRNHNYWYLDRTVEKKRISKRQKPMEWISVKDRLPEDNVLVLFHFPNSEIRFEVGIFSHDKDKSGNVHYRFYPFDVSHWEISTAEEYYWMPLPEPPKEKEGIKNLVPWIKHNCWHSYDQKFECDHKEDCDLIVGARIEDKE